LEKKNISALKIAAAYIGTVVGAGFATGQEILQFFAAFGLNGLWGIILATGLFILFGAIIMELGFWLNAKSHLEIIRHTGGPVFGAVMDVMISLCLFVALTAMMAGTGALFSQQFGLTGVLGNLIMAVLSVMTVLTGIRGVISAISAVVPFLLAAVIAISVFSIINTPPVFSQSGGNSFIGNWLMAAILYASYNIIMSISILGPLGASSPDKKTVIRGGVLGGFGLGAASVMIYLAICGNTSDVSNLEVPMSYIAGKVSPVVQMLYGVVLVAEIYTTAVGALYGLSARIGNIAKSPKKGSAIIIGAAIAALLASLLGFSNLVKYLYPIQGYCGIALLGSLLYIKIKSGWRSSPDSPDNPYK